MSHQDHQPMVTTLVAFVIFLLLVSCIAGCSTAVPVTAKFPEPPKLATQACPQLQKLNNNAKLSDVATTVTVNYGTYYECAVKNDAWIEWYNVQKNIFEKTK